MAVVGAISGIERPFNCVHVRHEELCMIPIVIGVVVGLVVGALIAYLYANSNGGCSGSFNNYSYGFFTDVSGTVSSNSFNVRGGKWRFKGSRRSGSSWSGTASNGGITYRLTLQLSKY